MTCSMKINLKNRHFISVLTVFLYLIPILFFASYTLSQLPKYKSWPLLTYGLLFITLGTLCFTLLLYYWEQSIRTARGMPIKDEPVEILSLDAQEQSFPINDASEDRLETSNAMIEELRLQVFKTEEMNKNYSLEIETLKQQVISIEEEKKLLLKNTQDVLQDFSDYKGFSEEQLKQKTLQISSLQQIIDGQKSEVEKRQDQIQQLDSKVRDLSYEIKTLLSLHETDSLPQETPQDNLIAPIFSTPLEDNIPITTEPLIRTSTAASALLKRCVNIAQKLTGAHYYGNNGARHAEITSSPYTIDQRCLFDNLRSETSGLILVYAPNDQKLLFSNNQYKNLLGWAPDKFLQEFPQIIQESTTEWKQAISHLGSALEIQSNLLLKTKNGQSVLFNCHFGAIPTGLFKHYIITILYPSTVS